jgi:transposase
VQAVVDAKHHLIVAHEVTNIGNDRSQLSAMAKQAQEAMGARELTAIADRGYFKGKEILACEAAGVTPIVPKPLTSGAKPVLSFSRAFTSVSTTRRRATGLALEEAADRVDIRLSSLPR